MRRIISTLTLLILAPVCLFGVDDFQVWCEIDTQVPVNENVSLQYRNAYRFDHNATRLHLVYNQLLLDWQMTKTWSSALLFRQVYFLHATSGDVEEWTPNSFPSIDIVKRGNIRKVEWAHRSRFNYIFISHDWHYRDRLKVSVPLDAKERFYIACYEELFFTLFNDFIQSRLYVGFQAEIWGKLRGNLGYMRRSVKHGSGRWDYQNILYIEVFHRF